MNKQGVKNVIKIIVQDSRGPTLWIDTFKRFITFAYLLTFVERTHLVSCAK